MVCVSCEMLSAGTDGAFRLFNFALESQNREISQKPILKKLGELLNHSLSVYVCLFVCVTSPPPLCMSVCVQDCSEGMRSFLPSKASTGARRDNTTGRM